jgi:copper transport protein
MRLRLGRSALAVVAVVLLFRPVLAFAHAYPSRSTPAPNAQLAQSPPTVEIWFTEHLEPSLSSLVVEDANQKSVQTGSSQVDPHDTTHLVASLPSQLAQGTYTVVWHAVSADDGDSTAGVFAFGVGKAADLPAVSAQQLGVAQGDQATPIGIIGRWLVYLATVVIVGTPIFVMTIVRPVWQAGEPSLAFREGQVRAARLIALALVVLLLGQVLRLVDEVTLAAATSASNASPGVAAVLIGTRFGAFWLGRFILLGVEAALTAIAPFSPLRCLSGRRQRWFWLAILAIGVVLITDLTWSGHAAASNLLAYASLIQVTVDWAGRSSLYLPASAILVRIAPAITLAIDWIHLAAVSVWIGGLICLASLTARREPGASSSAYQGSNSRITPVWSPRQLATTVHRFSRLAIAALVVVALSGLYNSWLYLAGPTSIVSTGYGQSLLLKNTTVAALLFVAMLNHFVTVPTLERQAGADAKIFSYLGNIGVLARPGRPIERYLRRHSITLLQIEAGLGLIVLLTTGLLTSLGPARAPTEILSDPVNELPLGTEPLRTILQTTGSQQLQLTISPGRVGENENTVRILDHGQPAKDVLRVYLAWMSPGLGGDASNTVELTPTGPATFQTRSLAISVSGMWRVDARIYRANGSVDTASLTLQATPQWAALVDPSAKALLSQAVEAMSRLHSARLAFALSNGSSGIGLDDMEFVAPDRYETIVPGAGGAIQIGTTIYLHGVGQPWTTEPNVSPYAWPTGAYADFQQGVGGIVIGQGTVLGSVCTIIAFYVPQSGGIYEAWIGQQDHLIHKYLMAAPSHYMVNLYYDFDAPVQIDPPGNP